jgi:arsenite-transporting ATPase
VRVVLFTGKGGVGKTTLAAATAAHVAAAGSKTLVLSTDPAHSLADALGANADSEPREVASGLFLGHVDAQRRLQDVWGDLQQYLVAALGAAGLDSVRAEELTVLPGAEELLALIEVRDQVRSGRWDAVIVDCAPTAETLRLLALPEALERMVARAFPVERRVEALLSESGLRDDAVASLDALDLLGAQLRQVRDLLVGPHAAVRLVSTPERVALAETRRARATLALLGHHVDGLVLNRVATGGEWPAQLVERHRDALVLARDQLPGLPVRHAPYLADEPVGVPALRALGRHVLDGADPLDLGAPARAGGVRRDGAGWSLDVHVPGAGADEIEIALTDRGDLVVQLGPHRRVLELPGALRRCEVVGARMRGEEGVVSIGFRPDPRVYPSDGRSEEDA